MEGPIGFAHRGGTGIHPENTLPAFAHAVSLGFTHLETDVHATADGVAVAFHDAELDRVTDSTGRISALAWSEVARARVGGTERIPRLDDLIDAFPSARFNLDPKSDEAVEPLVEVIRRTRSIERVCVTSFSGRRTRRVARELGPGLCHGLGPAGVLSLVLRSIRIPFPPGSGQVAQVPVRYGPITVVTERFVRAARRAGIAVHVWTIDDTVEMERLLDMGVDGIMTDRPDRLRGVLERRGHWPPEGPFASAD